MKRDALRGRLSSALLLILLLAQGTSPALAAQSPPRRMLKEEEREARAVADAFTRRLIEARDFAPVVRELYADDFMARYLRQATNPEAGVRDATFMIDGIPALSFRASLAAHAESEYWPRLYVAANSFMHFVFLSVLAERPVEELANLEEGDMDEFEQDMLGVVPPEALRILDGNPTLTNFVKMKKRPVDIETLEDLRQVTVTLEEAVRLTRASLDERLPKVTHLAQNLQMLGDAAARTEVESLPLEGDAWGYPNGTRFFKVFAPIGYDLILVKDGERMKVVWATIPHD